MLARQLATALAAVHRAQLVHRDLSPVNVLLTSLDITDPPDSRRAGLRLMREDEQVLVADLGMCKDLAINSGLTVAGGTTGFRPPEMQAGPAIVDGRADLYSLSALLAWVCEDADLPEALDRALARGQARDQADRHHRHRGAQRADHRHQRHLQHRAGRAALLGVAPARRPLPQRRGDRNAHADPRRSSPARDHRSGRADARGPCGPRPGGRRRRRLILVASGLRRRRD